MEKSWLLLWSSSLPQVPCSSAFPDEKEIDMSHFIINLCDMLLAGAEHV